MEVGGLSAAVAEPLPLRFIALKSVFTSYNSMAERGFSDVGLEIVSAVSAKIDFASDFRATVTLGETVGGVGAPPAVVAVPVVPLLHLLHAELVVAERILARSASHAGGFAQEKKKKNKKQ